MKTKIANLLTNPWFSLAVVGATAIGGLIHSGLAWGIFMSYFITLIFVWDKN